MPVVMVVRLRVSSEGWFDMFLNPVGTTITGIPIRFPKQTLSQSVALPTNASTLKLSFTSLISFPRALCAYWKIINISNRVIGQIIYRYICNLKFRSFLFCSIITFVLIKGEHNFQDRKITYTEVIAYKICQICT